MMTGGIKTLNSSSSLPTLNLPNGGVLTTSFDVVDDGDVIAHPNALDDEW